MAKLPTVGSKVLVHLKSGAVAPATVLKHNDGGRTLAVKVDSTGEVLTSLGDMVTPPSQPYYEVPVKK
jgi:hypothetical protein